MKREYIRALDGLKGICACIIAFTFHYWCSFEARPLDHLLFWGYERGKYCVEIFFVLSGFVMCLNYSEIVKDISFKDFMLARCRRLWPLFFITTLVTFCLIYLAKIYQGNFEIYAGEDLYHLFLNMLLLGCGEGVRGYPII